jgi:hypothetical protein
VTEYRVSPIKVGRVPLPSGLVARVLAHGAPAAGREHVAGAVLSIPTPKYLADIRVADGHLTLYKGLR